MVTELVSGLRFTLFAMLLLGGVYNAALWAVGQVAFPTQAEGRLVRRADGTVIGSHLIAQRFTRDEYFHPRPSAVDYNAASTGGSNDGASPPGHLAAVQQRLDAIVAREGTRADRVLSEMVTTSGAGLDPHIPPAAARLQAARVARARGVTVEHVLAVVDVHIEPPTLGFLGRARVNVLELNLALDAEPPNAPIP
jgi:K+-transporting ATPase ATPase C chain